MKRIFVVGLCLSMSLACQAKHRGVVSVEDLDSREPASVSGSVYAPICAGVELPEYPDIPSRQQQNGVLVRVDFVVEKDGSTSYVTARSLVDDEHASAFQDAAASTVSQWRCNPAWRLRRDDSEPPGQIPVRQRTFVVFRFDTEVVGLEGE